MRAAVVARAVLAAALLVAAARPATAEERGRTAVLEYRSGVDRARGLGDRLAERLKKLAALEVVDPAEARRRNARIDAEVGACAGDTECTARLATALATDEVLLVAVSQLGDLVLALQRVEASGKVASQLSAVIKSDAELTEDQLDLWLHQLYPPSTFKRYGYISVVANVDRATVRINDVTRGETPLDDKMKVPAPQTYRVGLTKEGRVPFSVSIDVIPDATVEVRAELPAQIESTAWYKRWYVWALIGGVAAGAAAGTAFYLTRPDDLHNSGFVYVPPK